MAPQVLSPTDDPSLAQCLPGRESVGVAPKLHLCRPEGGQVQVVVGLRGWGRGYAGALKGALMDSPKCIQSIKYRTGGGGVRGTLISRGKFRVSN